jgi:hypothetical protein
MELVTQIVILATAIVGLYKAVTFHHNKPEPIQSIEGEEAKTTNSFSDFFDLIGIFLFMLAFPAFLYAFMWIMNSLPNAMSSSSNSQEIPIVEIRATSTSSEVMLAAALNITSSHNRNEQLKKTINHAMSNKDYSTALTAASSISSSFVKNEELEKIIKLMSKIKQINKKKETSNKNEETNNLP